MARLYRYILLFSPKYSLTCCCEIGKITANIWITLEIAIHRKRAVTWSRETWTAFEQSSSSLICCGKLIGFGVRKMMCYVRICWYCIKPWFTLFILNKNSKCFSRYIHFNKSSILTRRCCETCVVLSLLVKNGLFSDSQLPI